MKESFQNFFGQYDLFSAPTFFRIDKGPAMKSCMLGILSLMIFAGLIYIVATNFINVINYQQITYQIVENTIPDNEVYTEVKMFALSLNFISLNQSLSNYDLIFKYQNYNATFYEYQINLMFCPNISKPYKISQTSTQQNFTSISISIKLYSELKQEICNLTYIRQYGIPYQYLRVWLYVIDTVVHPQQQQILEYKINIVKALMGNYNREYVQIFLAIFRVQTGTSVWPWTDVQVINGSMFSNPINNQYENYYYDQFFYGIFIQYRIQMNNKVQVFQRSIGKFDQVISYVGGLFAIVIQAFGWFLFSFNKYRYEIKVAQGAFNFDQQGNKIKEKDFHFGSYIKYSIYTWLNTIFCHKIKWKSCVQIDKVRDNVTAQMDSRALFRRLHKVEEMVLSKIDKRQEASIMLQEPLSLKNIKHERLKLDYYDEVIKGEAAVTLEDLLLQEQRKSNVQEGVDEQNNDDAEQMQSAGNLNRESNAQNENGIDFDLILPMSQGYHLVKETVDFVRTKEKAEKIPLSAQFEEVEGHLARVYAEFNESDKRLIENRVPMVILHRLNRKQREIEGKVKMARLLENNEEEEAKQTETNVKEKEK